MKTLVALVAGMSVTVGLCAAQESGYMAHASLPAHEVPHYGWADVLRVDPVYADDGAGDPSPSVPDCQSAPAPVGQLEEGPNGGDRAASTVIGAVVGAAIGSAFGHGGGRNASIAAGAVVGGVAGNSIAAANESAYYQNQPAPPPPGVRACQPGGHRVVAYDVEYRYRGETYTARLGYDPGDRMRVRISVLPAD